MMMLAQTSFCFFLLAMTYLNSIQTLAVSTTDLEDQNKKFADGYLLERFAVNPHRLFRDRFYDDENVDDDDSMHQKRQIKKKWIKLHHGAQSPYTIAFPALIRTRRSSF